MSGTDILSSFLELHKSISEQNTKLSKKGLKDIAESYSFIYISENGSINEENKNIIYQNIKRSPIIIFDQNNKLNEATNKKCFIIGFEQTLIILAKSSNSECFLNKLLFSNLNIPVCFLSNSKSIFDEPNEIKNREILVDSIFLEEIESLHQSFKIIRNSIFEIISPCISGYLIKKSYLVKSKYRIEKFIEENNLSEEKIKENEYVELRIIGFGSSFICSLIYHIKQGQLYAIKKPYKQDEAPKLIEREKNNYCNISHPFLCKFYGVTENENFIVIEFIKGETLNNIKKMKLEFKDILNIIFELMLIFQYFYDNQMIYRDLKPNNIMINENKEVVLIDFDRLIKYDGNETVDHSINVGTEFNAPEAKTNNEFTHASDIYSLGKIIEYILQINSLQSNEYSAINKIISKCINDNAKNRSFISDIIDYFILIFNEEYEFEGSFSNYDDHFTHCYLIINVINEYKKIKMNQLFK